MDNIFLVFIAVLYIFLIKWSFDEGSPLCGVLLVVVPLLVFLKYYFIDIPGMKKEEEERKIREEIELKRLEYETLKKYHHQCSICGGSANVIVVDKRSFVRSNSINTTKITICERCQVDNVSPTDFEILIGNAFQKMGYAVTHKGSSGGGGVDLIGEKDGEKIVIQCKRYKGTVGISAVRDFYGALLHTRAQRGYFITTGSFPSGAYTWIKGKPIVLVGRNDLANILLGSDQ